MTSYASTIVNLQTSARDREQQLRERELIARNAEIRAARAADAPPAAMQARGGMIAALLRVVGRPASAH